MVSWQLKILYIAISKKLRESCIHIIHFLIHRLQIEPTLKFKLNPAVF